MARLIIVSGPGAGTDHRLEGGRNSIGRDPANTIVLDDSLVSKRHAEIIRDDDGGLRIVDVGSSNGTLVNGRQVADHRLSHNDQIQLGECLLRFESEPEAAAVDEGAKTVLIDDAATRLAIPHDAVEAARARGPVPPSGGSVPDSTIYISDDEGSALAAAAAAPPAAPPGPPKRNRLPVMPILLSFIAVMVIIGCLLTWKVVQRSGSAPVEPASMAVPADAAGGPEGPGLRTDLEQGADSTAESALGAGASVPVEEQNLIAEPVDGGLPVTTESRVGSGAAGSPGATRPPVPGTAASRTVSPPPVSSTPPPARTSYTAPPARPREVPPAGGGQSGAAAPAIAAPPPAAPAATTAARPAYIVPDATHGVLHVITNPEGATIFINEEMVGTTNAKKLMSPGKYIIRLEHQGQSVTDDVKVKEQQVSTFYHSFAAPPSGKDEDEDEDDKDKKKKKADKDKDDEEKADKDKDDEEKADKDEADPDDEEDEEEAKDEDEDSGDEKKEKKGWKKKLKDIFG